MLEHEDSPIVYNKKRICGAHFTSDCLSPGTKILNCNSYPTLHIPAGKILKYIKINSNV